MSPSAGPDPVKAVLHGYLQTGREALLAKLDGLSEHDARRPLTPTGSNVLGIVKHVASVEDGYFTEVFGRPARELPCYAPGAEPNGDFWATEEESIDGIADFYRQVWATSDATIDELDLDAPGRVPWWGEAGAEVTLHRVLVHMIAETHRHAGHVDILREQVDGLAGYRAQGEILPDGLDWPTYRQRLQDLADRYA